MTNPKNILSADNYFNEALDYSNPEFIQSLYNLYIENLKTSDMVIKFFDIDNIKTTELKQWDIVKDKYLEDTLKNQMDLGYDILQNGTYFPIVHVYKEGKLRLMEGAHRVLALKELRKRNIIDGTFKILSIIRFDNGDMKENVFNYNPIIYDVPGLKLVNDHFIKKYLSYGKFKNLPDEIIFKNSLVSGYETHIIWALLLRNGIFEARKKYGFSLQGSPIINEFNYYFH